MYNSSGDIITDMRGMLTEYSSSNSRWTDAQLLPYVNEGISKLYMDVKLCRVPYDQTTTVGLPTSRGTIFSITDVAYYANSVNSSFSSDYNLGYVEEVFFDGLQMHPISYPDIQKITGNDFTTIGTPEYYCGPFFNGNDYMIYPVPNMAAVLRFMNVLVPKHLTTTSSVLPSRIYQTNDHLGKAVAFYGAYRALEDDDRDGSTLLNHYVEVAKLERKKNNFAGSRFTNMLDHRWY